MPMTTATRLTIEEMSRKVFRLLVSWRPTAAGIIMSEPTRRAPKNLRPRIIVRTKAMLK